MPNKRFIVAIDGPAGSGKSTVARLVAKRLGFVYVDTGAMYRALTLKAIREDTNLKDAKALIDLAHKAKIKLKPTTTTKPRVFLDSKDVTKQIRDFKVTNAISHIAKVSGVRKEMVRLQRAIGKSKKAVFEGRDIGTVVFPKADKKFYLDADFKERVRRRHKELIQEGAPVSFEKLKVNLKIRDKKDIARRVAPLRKAKDAILIDTTNMSINKVVAEIVRNIGNR